MKLRAYGETAAASGERGFALIVILSLAALISAYLIATVLNLTGAGLANAREERSMNALRQAKAALIAYAASEQWQLYRTPTTYFQPGALPCPDKNDNGDADCTGSTTSSMIGRLPWKTLGTDDLRDASGERLWYALSWNFRKLQGGLPPTVINSDTQGQLSVTGTAPASNAVAVVFAPGPALQGQNRDPANATAHNDPANYLESFNLDNPVHVNYIFSSSAAPSDTFNDRLLVITQAELMATVEPVVAARIQRDIKQYLTAYLNTWGRYPFPAAFPQPGLPALSDYKGFAGPWGVAGPWGLLPLTAAPTFVFWQNPLSTVVADSPPASITSPPDCTASSAALIDCTVAYNGTPTLTFSLAAANVGMTFVRSHVIADLTVTASGSPLSPAPTLSSVNNSPPPDASGKGSVSLSLNMPASAAPVRIQIPPPPLQPPPPLVSTSWDNTMMTLATPSSAKGAGWLIANQWYKQLFYAVAPDLVPGGSGNCIANPPCLTVNNLASPNNKQAILVFAGRALNGTSRPSGTVANYLENANLSAALGTTPFVYEHRAGVPTSINDRVVVVSP